MTSNPRPIGCPSDNVHEQRERWELKRSRTGRELVRSEQLYCHQLELVNTYFVEILKAKGTLRQDIRESIFSSIKSIHLVNQALLAYLEEGQFGLGFERFCSHLSYYISYVDNIQNALKVLQAQVKKNKAFRRFKKLQESRPEFQNADLEDLLPLPLKRMQQYKYFLRDLTENTSPENPEFAQLSGAVKAVSEVSQRIQDNARGHENQLQLRRVQRLLKGRKTKVLAPGRWYIREGWLKVVPPKGTEAKSRMFFLFSDILLIAVPCHPLHPTNGDKLECRRVYPLKECTVDKVFGHTKSQGGLISLTFTEDKLLLMSSDQEDINDWYRSLSSAVGQLMSKNTMVLKKDNLCRRPLRTQQALNEPESSERNRAVRKRNVMPGQAAEPTATPDSRRNRPGEEAESEAIASKRMKLSEGSAESTPETASRSTCVIL